MNIPLSVLSWSASLLGSVSFFLLGYWFFARVRFPSIGRDAAEPTQAPQPALQKSRGPGRMFAAWREARERAKRLEAAREVLPQALEIAIQALKTGQTVPQTLEYLSQESAPPLKDEFALVCREMAWGAPAEQALGRLAERIPMPDVERFLESYRLSRQTGANLTHLLQTLLYGMEERNRLQYRMEAMTAQARLSGILMGSLPVLLMGILFFMDPNLMTPLFTTGPGWCILAVAAFLEAAGFIWIRSLMAVEA